MHTRSFCSLDKQLHINLWSTKNQQTPCIPFVILIGNLFNSQERLDDFRYNRFCVPQKLYKKQQAAFLSVTNKYFSVSFASLFFVVVFVFDKKRQNYAEEIFLSFSSFVVSVFTEFPETLSRTCSLLYNQIVFRL